jgi:hypothetical protein
MKNLMIGATLAAFCLTMGAPVLAAVQADGVYSADLVLDGAAVEKRKKKRVKGGSGCDDARDVIEHPECR